MATSDDGSSTSNILVYICDCKVDRNFTCVHQKRADANAPETLGVNRPLQTTHRGR